MKIWCSAKRKCKMMQIIFQQNSLPIICSWSTRPKMRYRVWISLRLTGWTNWMHNGKCLKAGQRGFWKKISLHWTRGFLKRGLALYGWDKSWYGQGDVLGITEFSTWNMGRIEKNRVSDGNEKPGNTVFPGFLIDFVLKLADWTGPVSSAEIIYCICFQKA